MRYVTVSATIHYDRDRQKDLDSFTSAVTDKLNAGWKCVGGIAVTAFPRLHTSSADKFIYAQSMKMR